MSKETFLSACHIKHGAKLVDFAGFRMPVWYSSMKDEHLAVRKASGMFDISHMGVLEVTGAEAFDFLQQFTCNDAQKSMSGKMVYSMVLNDDGFILDDVMFGKLDERFILVVNAANKGKLLDWFSEKNKFDATIHDMSQTHAFVAIQGPEAIQKVSECLRVDLSGLKRFSIQSYSVLEEPVVISRTGYTGEDGVEIVIRSEKAELLWDTLLEGGVTPCGLAARDSLRIEAGLPLYGHELSETIHPLMTRYGWVIGWDTEFNGKAALQGYQNSVSETTVGIEMVEKMIPRQGQEIQEGGVITSGTLSPLTNKAIGMAIVPKEYAEIGTELTVNVRNRQCKASVVKVPFF